MSLSQIYSIGGFLFRKGLLGPHEYRYKRLCFTTCEGDGTDLSLFAMMKISSFQRASG